MVPRIAVIAAVAAVIGLLVSVSIASPGAKKTPTVRVFDGDSVQVDGTVFNLAGIDAPELGQGCVKDGKLEPCGLNSAYHLRKMLDMGKTGLRCQRVGSAAATAVADCVVGDQDVSLALIQAGQALALSDAPPDYFAAQDTAKQAGLGIWGSRFVKPEEWRRGERLTEEVDGGEPVCIIKGIPRDDRRLYFGPLDDGYETMDPTAVHGGRVFCSDDEARAAGWRRPQA